MLCVTEMDRGPGLAERLLATDPPGRQRIRALLAAAVLAAAFLAAGLGKLVDIPGFGRLLDSYRLLPEVLLTPLGLALALGELLVACALLLPEWRRQVALGATLLLLLDLAMLGQALARKLPLANTGTFGTTLASPLGWPAILGTGSLLALALFLLAMRRDARGAR
jgi:uncharacterized membrane protein YphA (DoxX/SURF4 family)